MIYRKWFGLFLVRLSSRFSYPWNSGFKTDSFFLLFDAAFFRFGLLLYLLSPSTFNRARFLVQFLFFIRFFHFDAFTMR